MQPEQSGQDELDPGTRAFYCRVLTTLGQARVPFLVGGAYAFAHYTGIVRHTKDFDIFVRPGDVARTLALLEAAGYRAERTFPHWLGKVFGGQGFVDIIYRSSNGVSEVDDRWFAHAVAAEVLGIPVELCAPEEILWTKALIMERERCDSADVAHLLLARGAQLDWQRLLEHFRAHWRVLLSHLILFGFIYPGERALIPGWVMDDLLGRLRDELSGPPPAERLCQGTLLSRAQYLVDVERWGYEDGRLHPRGNLTAEEIAHWTAAIEQEQ
jgi:hypothetical protein